MKNKIVLIMIFMISSLLFLNVDFSHAQAPPGGYVPMEPIPGTAVEEQVTFPQYVQALYRFLIWTSGIAALLMINVGGFMYFTAAGNASRAESGKKIVTDALLGLVAIMFAWMVLNIINPDLVKFDFTAITEAIKGSTEK